MDRVVGLEDSGAGMVSLRPAGCAAIGSGGANIDRAGVRPLLHAHCPALVDALPLVLGG
jgi:beta-phosphoglucomutase-like phosphatase (HAD superfamily)